MSDKIEQPAWEELEGELRDAVRLIIEENDPRPFQHPMPRIRGKRKKANSVWNGKGVVIVAAVSLFLTVLAIQDRPSYVISTGGITKAIMNESQIAVPSYWNYRSALAESPEAFERLLDQNTQSMNDQTENFSAFNLRRINHVPERKM